MVTEDGLGHGGAFFVHEGSRLLYSAAPAPGIAQIVVGIGVHKGQRFNTRAFGGRQDTAEHESTVLTFDIHPAPKPPSPRRSLHGCCPTSPITGRAVVRKLAPADTFRCWAALLRQILELDPARRQFLVCTRAAGDHTVYSTDPDLVF